MPLTLLRAAVLGLVQGATEFLPISSSAHLVLTSALLGWEDQGLLFDMAANTGSLVAVVFYFRRDLLRLARAWIASLRRDPSTDRAAAGLAWQLLLATVPVALVGLLLQDLVASSARRLLVIASATMFFGLVLGWADRAARGGRRLDRLGLARALAIGAAQALALVPGTSRSGITITAGLFTGLSREEAARFAFLLAVPVGVLVGAKDLVELVGSGPPPAGILALAMGCTVSALSALAAIHWLLAWVRRQSLTVFVVYRLILGLLIFALAV